MLNSRLSLIVFALLAHLPIFIQYSLRMWRSEHYQFFPLLIIGVAWFFAADIKELSGSERIGKPNLIATMFAVISVLVLVGTVLNSSFIGAVSLWCLFPCVCYWIYGIEGLKKVHSILFDFAFRCSIAGTN